MKIIALSALIVPVLTMGSAWLVAVVDGSALTATVGVWWMGAVNGLMIAYTLVDRAEARQQNAPRDD